MLTDYRECPQCGEAIEGRPNKKFCSDTCKGRYFRENNPPIFQLDSPDAVPVQLVKPSTSFQQPSYTSQGQLDEEEQWQQEEAGEKRLIEEKRAIELHKQFCGVVRDFLEVERKPLTARQLSRQLQKVADLTSAFSMHPQIRLSGNSINVRLKALYDIHDVLQETSQEIANKGIFQREESEFELTKKWRKALRELLIPD